MTKQTDAGLITTIKDGLAITTRNGAHVSTVRAAVSSATTATPLRRSLAARAMAAAKQAFTGMAQPAPLASASATPAVSPKNAAVVELWPEMVSRVATGRRIEIRRTTETKQPVNASDAARRILAAGERARGNVQTPFADAMASHLNPAKAAADRIIAAGERAFGKA